MTNQTKTKVKTEIRVDTYTRVCLTVIAVLLSVLIVGLWAETVPGQSRVYAQGDKQTGPFLDASAQRRSALEAQEKTNRHLEELVTLFTTGQAKVQVSDKPSSTRNSSRARSNVQLQMQKNK